MDWRLIGEDNNSNLSQYRIAGEAIVEYFVNDPDPWNINANLVPLNDASYQRIAFSMLYGNEATANGAVVTLTDSQELERITVGLDVLVLDTDTADTTKQYRILSLDPNRKRVTVDRAPNLPSVSKWYIRHRPQLVLIDAIGARVQGSKEVPAGTAYQIQMHDLDTLQVKRLKKSNAHFDTIDQNIPNSDNRTFRLLSKHVDSTTSSAVLEGDYGTSHIPSACVAWRIPAGVGGKRDVSVAWPQYAAKRNKGWWDN